MVTEILQNYQNCCRTLTTAWLRQYSRAKKWESTILEYKYDLLTFEDYLTYVFLEFRTVLINDHQGHSPKIPEDPVRLEPWTSRLWVTHLTTEPRRTPKTSLGEERYGCR